MSNWGHRMLGKANSSETTMAVTVPRPRVRWMLFTSRTPQYWAVSTDAPLTTPNMVTCIKKVIRLA